MTRIRNIAHRGLWNAKVPQNTIDAFRRAWAAGATWVETDFHHTAAGQMVCLHAEGELLRYSGCEKRIADLSPSDVATIRLDPERFSAGARPGSIPEPDDSDPGPDAFRIPLLDEVLATVPPHGTLQAEIKGYSTQYADIFDGAVRNAGLSEGNIVVSSFNFEALADFHARKPAYRTLLLVGVPKNGDKDVLGIARKSAEAGFWAFCPGLCDGDRPLTPAEVGVIRATGLSFRVYGVNSPEALRVAATLGAEAFTCNHWRRAFDWARDVPDLELLP